MVTLQKSRKTYCPYTCKTHTKHKVS